MSDFGIEMQRGMAHAIKEGYIATTSDFEVL